MHLDDDLQKGVSSRVRRLAHMFQLFQFLCCRGVCCLDSILSGADVIVVCDDWCTRASTLCIECKLVETLVVVSQNTPPRATARYITCFRQDEQPFLFGHEGNTRGSWPECGRVWLAGFHGLHMCIPFKPDRPNRGVA